MKLNMGLSKKIAEVAQAACLKVINAYDTPAFGNKSFARGGADESGSTCN